MNWLKTLMILALLAQPLCAVACDLSMTVGQDTQAQDAHAGHDCCPGDEDEAPQSPERADHCGDCAAVATLTVAATAPVTIAPGGLLPTVHWRPDTTPRAPQPRPPNA